jgi:ABC-type transport system substrate-binding protein
MKKSNLAILLSAVFLLQIGLVGVSVMNTSAADSDELTFIYGVGSGPVDLDPHYLWDSASADVAEQVCEGLYMLELKADPGYVPQLAVGEGSWSTDNLEFTVNLRTGVTFHDGTPFNATAVKWNFDRLMAFVTAEETQIAEMYGRYESDDSFTPMINKTVVVDEDTVKFVLNFKYAPFKALLGFDGSFMMSPAATPVDRFLEAGNDTLVGTGPFKYVSYDESKVVFKANADYYKGAPKIDNLIYTIIEDQIIRTQALLDGEIDMIDSFEPSYLTALQDAEHVTVSDGPNRVVIQYIAMHDSIPRNVRKAIAYAIDYDYLLDEILNNLSDRMTSPIPEGMMYHNNSFNYAILNLTEARLSMQAEGLGSALSLTDDAAWVALVDNDTPLLTLNYSWNNENSVRGDIGDLLKDNLKKIGIEVEIEEHAWRGDDGLVYKYYFNHEQLQLYQGGWIPDINDASNIVLLQLPGMANSADVNDAEIQAWAAAALETTDEDERQDLYNKIQEKVIEVNYHWTMGWVGKGFDAWNAGLTGYPQNPFAKVYFYPCEYSKVEIASGIPGYPIGMVALAMIGTVAMILLKRRS